MTRRVAGAVLLLFVANSCFLLRRGGGADELARLARRGTKATYAATYTFSVSAPYAGGVATTLSIVQRPPWSLRRLDTSTRPKGGGAVTVTSWMASRPEGTYGCVAFGPGDVRCEADGVARGTFGDARLAWFFDRPQDPSALVGVRREAGAVRAAGVRGTCYSAGVAAPKDSTGSASVGMRLCYTPDGILVLGRRTEVGRTSEVRLVFLSRSVRSRDLRLPGPVVPPDEMHG